MTALIGTRALVTGAGQGIGEAVAHKLVDTGIERIAIAARDVEQLEGVASELRGKGAEVLVIEMDLQDLETVARTSSAVDEAFGGVDVSVGCAGVTDRGSLFSTTPEVFDKIFNTNLRGNFFLMQAVAKSMVAQKSGVIINISSMLAHGGMTHLLPYSASKAALNLVTRNVAHALKSDRVRAHAINLGWTVTPAERATQTTQHDMPEDWPDVEGAKQPFGRLLFPDDPAGLCAFLASKDAKMMTGTAIDMEQWVSGVLGD
ncbi:MAG: oxidoreductase [Pseudomonadota bacterium]